MRNRILTALMTVAFLLPVTPAQAKGVGVGMLLQTNLFASSAGLSIAGEVADKFTLAGAFVPFIGRADVIYGHLDFLIDIGDGFETGGGPIQFYFGPGLRFMAIDVDSIGPRLPVGMRYDIHDTDVSFFIEAAPAADIFINSGFAEKYQIQFQGGIGIRYHFNASKAPANN